MRKLPQCFVRSIAGDTAQLSPSRSARKENGGRGSVCVHRTPVCVSQKRPSHAFHNLSPNTSKMLLPMLDASEFLACDICLEEYDGEAPDRVPRTLPYCGHTLCTDCLRKLIAVSKDFIVCHICKKRNPLAYHKTAEDFPCSWALLRLLTEHKKMIAKGAAQPKAEQFEKCNVCKKHEVSHWCRHHAIKLCAYCAFRHIKECQKEKLLEQTALPGFFKETMARSRDFVVAVRGKIKETKAMKDKFVAEAGAQIEEVVRAYRISVAGMAAKIDFCALQLELLAGSVESALGTVSAKEERSIPVEDHALKTLIRNITKLEDLVSKQVQGFASGYSVKLSFSQDKFEAEKAAAKQLWWDLDVTSPYMKDHEDLHDSFFQACERGETRIVDYMVENMGVDVNSKDQSGRTAFCISLSGNRPELYQLLHEKHGANVDVQDNAGKTALIYACLSNDEDSAKYLVRKCKANPNIQNKWKDTALHSAVEAGNLNIVKLLVEEADVRLDILNNRGKTAAETAIREEIRQYLLLHTAACVK